MSSTRRVIRSTAAYHLLPFPSTTPEGVRRLPTMSFESGSKIKTSAATAQASSSDRQNPLKSSRTPALTKQIGPVKQVPESKQPIVQSTSSSNPKRAAVPKQSTSTLVTVSGSKKATPSSTGDTSSKQIINNQAKPPAEGWNRSIAKEIEALKALVAEQAGRYCSPLAVAHINLSC